VICSLSMPFLFKTFTICLTLSLTLSFSSHSMLTSLRCAHENDCSIRTCFLSPRPAHKRFYRTQHTSKDKSSIHYTFISTVITYTTRASKASKALGKAFVKRSSQQSALGENLIGKGFFVESHLSGTQQSLCRVPDARQSGK
jgi:hypothetical protein